MNAALTSTPTLALGGLEGGVRAIQVHEPSFFTTSNAIECGNFETTLITEKIL